MKILNRWVLFLFPVLVAILMVGGAVGQDIVKGVRYALDYYANGQTKTQLFAGTVESVGNVVKARDVRVECYTVDGKLDVVILAKECEYTKVDMLVTSESEVKMVKDNIIITGTGFKWDGKEQKVDILSRAKVVFSRKVVKKRK